MSCPLREANHTVSARWAVQTQKLSPLASLGILNTVRAAVGDWNNDLVSDLGVARPNATGGPRFSLDSNGNLNFDRSDAVFHFGLASDTIVVGDWDGDGDSELGVARPNNSGGLVFPLDSNGNRAFVPGVARVFSFGLASDIIVIGDWDGNGIDELGVARPNATGGRVFSLDSNGSLVFDPGVDQVFNFGLANDRIVVGDWNANGIDKLGVARPNATGGLVYSLDSNGNRAFDPSVDSVFNFGLASDRIVTGSWSAGTQGTSFVTGFGSPGVGGNSATWNYSASETSTTTDQGDTEGDVGLDAFDVIRSTNGTNEASPNTGGRVGTMAFPATELVESSLDPGSIDLVFSSERSRPQTAGALDPDALDAAFALLGRNMTP
jgi:hypothetical protein